ncbi:MAG TPA: hypothetical protein VNN12_00965 [Dehalococcoidia bacterium]|nr:hypothetical protein [Dehalococcoidia bacterium]
MAEEITLTPVEGLRVSWQPDALGQPGGHRIEGSLAGLATLRLFSGTTDDGSALALCAARPRGAAHHDEEAVAAVVIDPEGNVHEIEEALVSTEYGADGSVRRLGFELYKNDADYPVRAAADARPSDGDGTTVLDFRIDGHSGTALCEVITP